MIMCMKHVTKTTLHFLRKAENIRCVRSEGGTAISFFTGRQQLIVPPSSSVV